MSLCYNHDAITYLEQSVHHCVSTQWCTAHCTQTTHCPKNTVQPLSDPQQWHLTMKH